MTESEARESDDPRMTDLIDALRDEERWVERLSAILRDHRASLVRSDAEGAEAAVWDIRRVVATLVEARRRRDLLLTACTGREGLELDEVDLVLGEDVPDDLVAIRASLAASADRLRGEVSRNRRILLELNGVVEAYLDRAGTDVPVEPGPR